MGPQIVYTVFLHTFYILTVYGYHSLSQEPVDFWDETEPFGQDSLSSKDLRLSSHIVPSYYRLKKKVYLNNSSFVGKISITLRANKGINKIILHTKDLSISNDVKLTEQIYEKLDPLHLVHKRSKRELSENNIALNISSSSESTDIGTNITTEVTTTSSNTTTATVAHFENSSTTRTETLAPNKTEEKQINIQSDDTQLTHSSVRNIKVKSLVTEKVGDRLIIALAADLRPGIDYILELSFNGTITDTLTGFYKSDYLDANNIEKRMGVTQFEPISARAAFPCFDEPGFKAMFEISISHKKHVTVLSNMKVSTQEDIANEPDWIWTHFDRSVNMSTYLVAYVLSEFKALETSYISKDNLTKYIKIWARPELINQANYALSITPKLLEFYENVFGVPYALNKIDLIAIPDFSSGAMENWGLMTFRETTLLFDEKQNGPRDKQNVAIDVAHELAHQWFGNLVTMKWWSDLWLNEGFATYIEYIGVNHIEPEWKILESFTRDKMDLLRSDALKNTSPVSREVIDASEISQKFDEISYSKGASLIRMLNHTITHELFHKGLVLYLNRWKYSNAEENDLWVSMSAATKSDPALDGISVVEFMNSWTRQAGYPVVEVTRNYKTGDIKFEQKLFSSAKEPYKKMVEQLWQIPISYTTVSAPLSEWTTKPKIWLNKRSTSINVPAASTDALYVNIDAIGYYRVNYDSKNWELLSKALKKGKEALSPLTRAQLIDDAFNLAKASRLDYSYALDLTTYVIHGEDSKVVWDLLLNNLAFLKYNLRMSPYYIYFQDYMRQLLSKQLKKLNYGLDTPKDDNEAFLIENLVMWECYVEAPRCLQWARTEFAKWVAEPDFNNNPIPNYLRSLVYTIALRHGGRPEFDFLWKVYENTTDPSVKNTIINTIASTRDESLIALLLEKSLTEIPNQHAPAVWNVDTPIGFKVTQQFLIKNWDRVYNKFIKMDAFIFPAILNGAFGFITTTEELNKLKAFALQHKEELMSISQTLQKVVDTANLRINWLEKHLSTIEKWLKDYVTGNSSVTLGDIATNEVNITAPSTNESMTTEASSITTEATSTATEATSIVTETTSTATEATSIVTETTSTAAEATSTAAEATSVVTESTSAATQATNVTNSNDTNFISTASSTDNVTSTLTTLST